MIQHYIIHTRQNVANIMRKEDTGNKLSAGVMKYMKIWNKTTGVVLTADNYCRCHGIDENMGQSLV
jgi:hypothetical protein